MTQTNGFTDTTAKSKSPLSNRYQNLTIELARENYLCFTYLSKQEKGQTNVCLRRNVNAWVRNLLLRHHSKFRLRSRTLRRGRLHPNRHLWLWRRHRRSCRRLQRNLSNLSQVRRRERTRQRQRRIEGKAGETPLNPTTELFCTTPPTRKRKSQMFIVIWHTKTFMLYLPHQRQTTNKGKRWKSTK